MSSRVGLVVLLTTLGLTVAAILPAAEKLVVDRGASGTWQKLSAWACRNASSIRQVSASISTRKKTIKPIWSGANKQ